MTYLDALVDDGFVTPDTPLAPLTTYKFGGPAAFYAEVEDLAMLQRVVSAAASDGLALLVLGRGSNLVVSDAGFPGVVVRLAGEFLEVVVDSDGTVVAGGAVPLPKLARTAVRAGRRGLEFFVGIPGSVGGAVAMNAGCHGSETADQLVRATIVSAIDGSVRHATPVDLDMSYRHSDIDRDDIVVSAVFATSPGDPDEGEAVLRQITQWRKTNQPGGTLNAGSVFKNPPGDAAGRLIDSLGLKGFRCGGASVSTRHANFFEAAPDTVAQDVYDLIWAVRRRVGEETGVWLEPEVRFAGPFRPNADEVAGPLGSSREAASRGDGR